MSFSVKWETHNSGSGTVLTLSGSVEREEATAKPFRRISAQGLPLIGRGQTAAVYRLNEEQVLKLYKQGFPLSMVRQERDMTAAAHEAGFSAPIPFELVTVGKQYGAVYEYVPGLTLKRRVLEDPSHLSYYAAIYADFIKSSRKNTLVRSGVPSLKQRWKELASAITLSDASERASLLDALDRIPDCACSRDPDYC